MLNGETENRGYYNAERVSFTNNEFSELKGVLLSLYRGGPDESTLGPNLLFTKNKVTSCNTIDPATPLIDLTGVQQSRISWNHFKNCNSAETAGKLIRYADNVRANHILENNFLSRQATLLQTSS